MKTSVVSGELLLFLLPLLTWNSVSGLEPAVTALCSEDWLVVRMKKWPFGNDTEVKISDIYLGNNCSATRALLFNYEFSYPATNCGIKKIVFQGNDMIMLSEIKYRPTLDTTYKFEVLCFLRRLILPPMIPFGMNGYVAGTLKRVRERGKGEQSGGENERINMNFSPFFSLAHFQKILVSSDLPPEFLLL
ncbi:oocyte-secreted protein 4B [Tamandua tetradactyla]|uniref:oocyte-secreted protein 4B n=1 Tax=Tamandua tetradactyla TaxID=48850 RepID=UPI00405453B0